MLGSFYVTGVFLGVNLNNSIIFNVIGQCDISMLSAGDGQESVTPKGVITRQGGLL